MQEIPAKRYIVSQRAKTPFVATQRVRQDRQLELMRLRRSTISFEPVARWLRDKELSLPPESLRGGEPDEVGVRGMVRRAMGDAYVEPALAPGLITGTCMLHLSEDAADALRKDLPEYELVEDRPLSLIEPVLSDQPLPAHDGGAWQWLHAQVKADKLHALGLRGKGVTVAVLDTGVDGVHPALQHCIAAQVIYDYAKGQWQWQTPAHDTHLYGHGTHVAGIVGGRETGLAPAVSILSNVMIPKGQGWVSHFVNAINWAGALPDVDIVNISAGLDGFFPEMLEGIRLLLELGILPVIAIGNDGHLRTRSPGNYAMSLSVGACDRHRNVAAFSGGATMVHDNVTYHVPRVVAPGVDVYSCIPGGGYGVLNGTSMAAPVVSGIAALLWEKYPNASVHEIIDALVTTCDPLGSPPDREGAGMTNAGRALTRLQA